MQCTENGFQTLEVLREGLWASFTGGWFYDLRQNIFCNTFHLYLWLFLLCFPFIVHLYFPPSPVVSSFYCGTVGIVFIFLKLVNHRLHRMFDTSECIQETIPGEDLPQSLKKRTQSANGKAMLEDEWYELKELNSSKVASEVQSFRCFVNVTDDDSINSSEAAGRPVSSTIDLKVDVHHKNSSESSEDLSLKLVIEDETTAANESEQCGLLEEGKNKASDSMGNKLRSKQNQISSNKLQLMKEESVMQDADLNFSLSDCHIAKLRTDSIDDLNDEYKISQSECHISNFFHNNEKEPTALGNRSSTPARITNLNSKNHDHIKKKYRKGFSRHLGAESPNEKHLISSQKSDCFDISNFSSNGSCGVLTVNQNNKGQIKNTGSLELPLKDTDNTCSENGLLYWKQQNLDTSKIDNLRDAQKVILRPCNKLHVCSEINIHASDKTCAAGSTKTVNRKLDLCNTENLDERNESVFQNSGFCYQDGTLSEQNSEQSFLEILEENFDWYSSEYRNEKTEKLSFVKSKIKEISKFKSDENIREEKFEEVPVNTRIKFQVDSDEDSSDNCGSKNPLLCRHESLEKENNEKKMYIYNSRNGKKMARTFSNEENNSPRINSFNKIIRTLSVDEGVVLSRKYKTSEILPKVEGGIFGSVLLSVYDDNDAKLSNHNGRTPRGEIASVKGCETRSSKSFANQPLSPLNHKLAHTSPSHLDYKTEGERSSIGKDDKVRNNDILSLPNEKIGLEWLFDNPDNEAISKTDKMETSKNVYDSTDMIDPQNQGAIPKTKLSTTEWISTRNKSHESKSEKLKKNNLYEEDEDSVDLIKPISQGLIKKRKNERENGIIDEEDFTIVQDSNNEDISRDNRDNYDSSNNSNFELSSLLPLSSLLSSLHPPSSPLLAAFLATRKDLPGAAQHPGIDSLTFVAKENANADEETFSYHPGLSRNRNKRIKRPNKFQRASRSSIPLAALASVVSNNSGTHIATSHDDTSQGAVHCFQDERGNWISYIFDSSNTIGNHSQKTIPISSTNRNLRNMNDSICSNNINSGKNNHINANNNMSNSCSFGVDINRHASGSNKANNISNNTNNDDDDADDDDDDDDNSKHRQSVVRNPYISSSSLRERNISSASVSHVRPPDENNLRQRNDLELKKLISSRGKMIQNKNQSSESCDSNINLVSNSNSENESSLSVSSMNVSPRVEVCLPRQTNCDRDRSTPRHYPLVTRSNSNSNNNISNINNSNCGNNSSRSSADNKINNSINNTNYTNNSNNNNNNNNNNSNNNDNNSVNNIESSSGPIVLSLGEFRHSDSNNNHGRDTNFFLEAPFSLLTDTSHERNRQGNGLPSPNVIPDFRISLNAVQYVDDIVGKRNHFRLFDLDLESNAELKKKQRHYYKLYYTPLNYIKIRFDRLELIALLDRNLTVFEVVLSLLLSFAVSICGITLLNYGFYRDLVALLFCFTMAGCHYSLLKSVQPDATSPTHGYNRVVIYSRSIYFCLASLVIIFLSVNLDKKESHPYDFYSLQLTNIQLLRIFRDGLLHLLLFFPMLFTLGVFPQINTFCLYILEQMDIHILGGHAMSNLIGATYCILRSITSIFVIYGFAYGALGEEKTSQHILFSIFCGLLVALSYHLSRSSSNPNVVWEILKDHIFQEEILQRNYANQYEGRDRKGSKKDELNKSTEGSIRSDKLNRNDVDDKSDDKNSQNNLLLNSNPSSNETLKTIDTHMKSNFSENFDNSGNASEIYNIKKDADKEFIDPLPGKLKNTVNSRLKNDAIVCCFVAVLVFALHSSTVFTALQPDLNPILWGIAGCSGIVLHYIVPQLRKQLPWLCLARPVLRSHEHGQFEVRDAAKVMWFEETYVILCFLEQNLLYPVLVLATLTYDGPRICEAFGVPFGSLITTVCGLKMMRTAFSNTAQQYLIVIFTALLFEFDYHYFRKTFLIDYFFMGIVFSKTYEFLLKMQFVVTYIAPWQITWGSTFHAFAQLFSVPHSALLLFQTGISALLSAPLNPFLGSALFFCSYVRPVKFWERDYNTKRVDHSNTRLSSHLERNLGSDDNNLNSIFYEHLTRSLQHNLCGDLELGRWGPAYQGDCFILASDYLNCLVHIIEIGNGLVTFQMRGLEFRGTFCQQREVEAISEGVEENDGCCCCQPGHLPNILSVNAAFSQRWLAWEVTSTKYVLEGYSISDNSAKSMLQSFDFRKALVTYYVKSIIFYCIRSQKLNDWLNNSTILAALEPISDRSFVDLDPVFNVIIDQDFDIRAEGITRTSFCNVYLEWIQYCASKREKPIDKSKDSPLISLCLALSLMGRRTLGTASHNTVSNVEFFLYGLHALFKGDFRITSVRDEWIFSDMELLKKVVAPGVRMSLKLHQNHFMSPEEYENPAALYEAISNHEENLVISHEGDPIWRGAVLSGTPSLLALRHVLDDGADEYKIIMLNKRYLGFRVIKLNRECVRGLWAGQQQELVFFRNRNPERGSIQNAKQVLRNIINSSCDQPIGYPIYVSPLTTSYSDTNKQFTDIIGGPLSLNGLKQTALKLWSRIRQRCTEGCSSGSAANMDDGAFAFGHDGVHSATNMNISSGYGHNTSGSQSMDSSQMQLGGSNRGGSLGRSSIGGRGSLPSVGKPSSATLASLAGILSSAELSKGESFLREMETSFTFIKERTLREEKESSRKLDDLKKSDDTRVKFEDRERKKEDCESRREKKYDYDESKDKESSVYQRVRIIDPNQVFDAINLGRRIDVLWPDEGMRARGGRSHWKDWLPDTGMEGQVVHRWIPNHRDPSKRSNVDKTILLVKIDDRFVPIAEAGVQDLGAEV